jgi:hypothetical protein
MEKLKHQFKGSEKLQELTKSLPDDQRNEILIYIGRLERHIVSVHDYVRKVHFENLIPFRDK